MSRAAKIAQSLQHEAAGGQPAPVQPADPAVPPLQPPLLGTFSPRALVDLLFSVAGPSLARADLVGIVRGGAEYVEQAADNAAHVAEGLGCLVAYDGHKGAGAGSFQDGQAVAGLMFHMQAHFRALESVGAAIGWAAQELEARADK